jgi:hypothetical protein
VHHQFHVKTLGATRCSVRSNAALPMECKNMCF